MELECIKYKEKMDSAGAYCRHPDDYCKYRTSCIIHFTEKENGKAGKGNQAVAAQDNVLKSKTSDNDRT